MTRTTFLVALISLTAVACSNDEGVRPEVREAAKPDVSVKAFSYDGLSPHAEGPNRPTYRAFRSQQEWEDFWPQLAAKMPGDRTGPIEHLAPVIDFSKYVLVLAALGQRADGGSSIALTSVTESDSRILER
jgi:hypothetical protein